MFFRNRVRSNGVLQVRQAFILVLFAPILALPVGGQAQGVSGSSTGQCNYNDGRGWVQCGDFPAGSSSSSGGSASGGPNPVQQQAQQQMFDAAGQLGFSLGQALGRALSGAGDREKAQGLNQQAIGAANRGDWFGAKRLFLEALKLAPDDETLKSNLAMANRQIAATAQQEAARQQQEVARQQEMERAAATRRREEMAQHLNGALKMADNDATVLSGGGDNPLGLKLGDDAEFHNRGTGTNAFGLGGKASDRYPGNEPSNDSHVVDLRDTTRGQNLGGAGMAQGPADKAPAGRTAVARTDNPLGLKLGDTAAASGDARVVDLRPAAAGSQEDRVAQLLARSDQEPEAWRAGGAFMTQVMPDYLKALGWKSGQRNQVMELVRGIKAYKIDLQVPELQRRYAGTFAMDRATYAALRADARRGHGRDLIAEGFQSEDDCAVFALANATNTPYGVAAARALEVIRTAPWRSQEERTHPAQVFSEGAGLKGGEVDILAQSFGEGHRVGRGELEGQLQQGSAIIATIDMASDNVRGSHEIVITRSFQHAGQAWYEVLDSNASPSNCPACERSRTYWPKADLEAVLNADGLAVTPKAGTVAKSLK